MTPEKASVAWNIAAGLGVLLLLSLFIPIKSGPHGISPKSKAINQLKSLTLACRAYEADWEGKLPLTLESLYPDYVDVEDLFLATDRDGKKIPIIYHSGNTEEEGESLPLLEWPIPFGDFRLISDSSGHVTEEQIEP